MSFQNQRGTALRHPDKKVRVGTHLPVLKMCIDRSPQKITHVFEHGMGLASTSFFHTLPDVTAITSLEDDPRWRHCDGCSSDTHATHVIVPYNVSTLRSLITDNTNYDNTIALVDGPHLQRIHVISELQSRGVRYIVEHDAESLPLDELHHRTDISTKNMYNVYQYVTLNPETILYTRDVIQIADYIKLT